MTLCRSWSHCAVSVGVCAILLPACGREDGALAEEAARYQLTSVGGQPLPHVAYTSADRPCSGGLRAGRYELAARRWIAVDTLFERCTDSASDSSWVRTDSGTFSLRGDTIQFENPAAGPGEAQIVLLGLLRGDTLTAWGSDLDGGDYIYIRR